MRHKQAFPEDAYSTCSGHGLNVGKNANFARGVTLKRSRRQRHVGLVILTRMIKELVHKIIDGPSDVPGLTLAQNLL